MGTAPRKKTHVTDVDKDVEDDFADIVRHTEQCLGRIWNSKSDDVWNRVP